MRKKSFALMLSALLCVSSFTGLASCGKRSTPGSGSTNNIEEGIYKNTVTAKTVKQNPADNRAAVYEAYSSAGESLGTYKTIAAAINEAVANDSDEDEYGGYVLKTGTTQKLFLNREGYADGNDDVFWYYDEGTKLVAMNCFDSTDSISMLHNSNILTTNVTGYGSYSTQSWNGYKMLSASGQEVTGKVAQSWELSSTMDSAVMYFTARSTFPGITRLSYTVDMSDVKIVPNYEGTDTTYAFMGFYAWQDYYVIATGIACDVSTGNWYVYQGTSRDDSFSDVEYNLGECLMTSTWNEAGYFTPDADTVNLSIETLQLTDEDDEDEKYQVDSVAIKVGDAEYTRYLTNEFITQCFAGASLAYNNAYAFTAGLDIKNKVVKGVKTASTDYFNGAKFENLAITSATAYIPTVEEMSDMDYGSIINSEWRGKEHNLVMAGSEHTDGIYDYTILNTAAFVNYTAQDGKDVYSFDYSKSNTSDELLTGQAKIYQDEINTLSVVTPENAYDYKETIKEIRAKYSKDNLQIHQKYYNVLDLTLLDTANKALTQAATKSVGGQLAVSVNAMGRLTQYNYSGWESDEEEADGLTGYLWTDVQAMYALLQQVESLTDADKEDYDAVLELSDTDIGYWTGTYRYISALASDEAMSETVTLIEEAPATHGPATATGEKTYLELVQDAFKYSMMIAAGTKWGAENDDPNNAKVNVMNFDNNAYPSVYLVTIVEILTEKGIDLPEVLTESVFETIAYDDFYEGAYAPIAGIVRLVNRLYASETTLTLNDLTAEELELLNTVWTGNYTLSSQISWNWISGNKFLTYYMGRIDRIIASVGGALPCDDSGNHKFADYADYLNAWLEQQGYTANVSGWGVTAAEIVAQ